MWFFPLLILFVCLRLIQSKTEKANIKKRMDEAEKAGCGMWIGGKFYPTKYKK